MKNIHQRGNAAVIIIIVAAIAVLATLGFVLWHNATKAKTNTDIPSVTEQQDPATTTPTPTYIQLADWNIKMKVPDGLAESDIKYEKDHIAEAPEYYRFNTAKIIAQGDECSGGYPFGDIVALERTTNKQTAIDNAKSYGGELINASPINSYYYYYRTSIASTTPVPACATTETADSERGLLIDLVKSINDL